MLKALKKKLLKASKLKAWKLSESKAECGVCMMKGAPGGK